MAWKHWLSRNKDWCCHCMPDCQHNGWFLVSTPNKPFSLASKARIQLHGCQPRCRSRWSLSMLISGSSSSLFIHLSCFLYLSKSSWPGFIWAVSLFPIGWLRKAFLFFLPPFCWNCTGLTVASVTPGLRFFVSLLHCDRKFEGAI